MIDWSLEEATAYVTLNTLDNEDFLEADDVRKTSLLNVSHRELTRKFRGHIVPMEAVYLFANTLASAYNDTNKLQQQGIASFAVKGITYTFKDWAKKDIDMLIPPEIYDLVGVPSSEQRLSWTVM